MGYYLELPGSSEGQLLGAESGCAALLPGEMGLSWEYPYNVRCNSIIKAKITMYMLVVRCKAEYCEPTSRRKGGPAAHNIMLLNHIGASKTLQT